MTFDELSEFITQRMRMSHIYQPVMLMPVGSDAGAQINAVPADSS